MDDVRDPVGEQSSTNSNTEIIDLVPEEMTPDGHFGFMDEYGVTGSSFPVTLCPFPVTP